MRGKIIHYANLEEGQVFFKYERLPIFCYQCSILGHKDRECHKIKKGCYSSDDDFQFGPWFRAMAPKFVRKK